MERRSWDPVRVLEKYFGEWEDKYANGGKDPTWPDGYNLNRIRRQIIVHKQEMEQEYVAGAYPEIYHRETPPVVSDEYVAKADEIRARAKKALALYLQDENFLYLWEVKDSVPPKEAKRLFLKGILNCTSALEFAIITDDLLTMRRHMDAAVYLSYFASCAEKVRELLPNENIQIGIPSMNL